jgi:hypothetical protein
MPGVSIGMRSALFLFLWPFTSAKVSTHHMYQCRRVACLLEWAVDKSLLQEQKEAARVENVQITRERDRIIHRSTEGRLRITAIFPAEIRPEAAKTFSEIFHAEMDRIEQQAAKQKNTIQQGID